MKNLILAMCLFIMGAGASACGQTLHLRAVNAQTHEPIADATVERKKTKHYGLLRLEGKTTVETLAPTNLDGEVMVTDVTGDDSILFDRDGYWPAVVNADFPRPNVDSQSHDDEARDKTGLIAIDTILAIKARIRKQLGINEGGKPAKKDGDVIIVPMHPIGG